MTDPIYNSCLHIKLHFLVVSCLLTAAMLCRKDALNVFGSLQHKRHLPSENICFLSKKYINADENKSSI